MAQAETDDRASESADPVSFAMVPCGILIDGYKYIPEDIYQAHLPFAAPPGTLIQRLYTSTGRR